MAQKWNNAPTVTSNVFREFSSSSENSSQIQNDSSNNIHANNVSEQIHDSQQGMIHSGNSYIGTSTNTKETCQRNKECNFSENSCQLNIANVDINHQQAEDQSTSHEEDEKSQNIVMCFVCCSTLIDEKNYSIKKTSMSHSHAPLLVLLIDVLGYKLDDAKLHTQFVCQSCYHLLNIIDELQQTLTESKTDLRTKFLDTIQRLKLKYPRTDKMLKPRCLRCVQMTQSTSRKRSKGNGGGGRVLKAKAGEEGGRGKGVKSKAVRPPEEGSSREGEGACIGQENGIESEIDVDNVSLEDKMCQAPEAPPSPPSPPSNIVFDTDPVFFSPDEKLKVGVMKEAETTPVFHCAYCTAHYDSALALKMHVRVYHMPVLVYDSGQVRAETRHRMGIKLQDCSPNQFSSTEKPYACLFCVSAYKLQSSIQFHFRENHSPHKPFQCVECKESFRRTIELSRHRLYRCPMKKEGTVQPKR